MSEPRHTEIRRWIEEERQLQIAEGDDLSHELTEAGLFHNTLANHINEFVADRALTVALFNEFTRRGISEDLWSVTLFMLAVEANQAQRLVVGWLMDAHTNAFGSGGQRH
jgi:hypothetical protein